MLIHSILKTWESYIHGRIIKNVSKTFRQSEKFLSYGKKSKDVTMKTKAEQIGLDETSKKGLIL